MSNNNNNLPIPSKPNFDEIKTSLKEYLKQQDILKDYNFDGSVLNTLLDVLSYNSYFNAFYMNMIATESFIDTAQKRHNLIRLAENYGYSPVSAKSSKLELNLKYEWVGEQDDIPNEFILPFGTTFITNNINKNYIFTLLEDTIIPYDEELGIYETTISTFAGKLHTETITVVDDTIEDYTININSNLVRQSDLYKKGIVLQNINVDSDSIFVYVNDEIYSLYNNAELYSLDDNNSKVYWVSENINGKTTVSFDKLYQRVLDVGTVIRIAYLSTYGSESNGITNVKPLSNIHGFKLLSILTPNSASYGGAEKEHNDNIRINAKRHYESQGRCVTAEDYKYFVNLAYPNAKSIHVWGGQDNIPPVYGKVFISLLTQNGAPLTSSEKTRILDYIKKRNIITIEPEFVDVNYMLINIDSLVYYKSNKLTQPINNIMSDIQTKIRSFGAETLNKHNNVFEYSKLTALIDSSDTGVIGNETNITLTQSLVLNTNNSLHKVVYTFDNEISKGSLVSSKFNYNGFSNCYFKEYGTGDGKSAISINTLDLNGNELILVTHAGIIDYLTGKITFDGGLGFNSNKSINLTVKPTHNVINVQQNMILNIGKMNIKHKHI